MTALPPAPNSRPAVRSAALRWRPALLLIGLAGVAFGFVFRADAAAAAKVWIDSTAFNHCFLILPLIAFLLWERRSAISAAVPRPALWPLLVMPGLSAVWLVAAVLDIHEGRQLMVVAMFEIVLLVALGPRVFRLLLAPFLFLFFLVPTGGFLVPTLQKVTASIVVAGLHALHIPVFSDGNMIEIPEGTFEIAEACAGLRFLIASSVFGCFFAVVMYRSFVRRAVFIALSLAVPIGANGLRALGIIVLAHLEGSATAVEADHVLYGWFFFSLVTLLLIAIGMLFLDKPDRRPPPIQPVLLDRPPWRMGTAITAAVLLALMGPAYAARLDSLFPATPLPATASPHVAAPWRALSWVNPVWGPEVHGADRAFLESFEEPGSGVVIRYLALYRLRAVGNRLTNTENRIANDHPWAVAQRGSADLALNGRRITVTSTQIVDAPLRRLVWSFYVVDGKIAAGLIETKLLQARATLLGRAPVAAYVAISASMDNPDDPASDQLTRFLAASEPLPQYIDMLGRRAQPGG